MHNFSNQNIATLLRSVAAALTLKKANLFKIKAYDSAADGIEHLTANVKDLWEEKKLDQIPGVGSSIAEHLDELFRTGKVKHFEDILKGFHPTLFELLDIPGVGPKTALELDKLGVRGSKDLKQKLESGELYKEGFSEKMGQKILLGLKESESRTGRMLLKVAEELAEKILDYLKKGEMIEVADPLGSLRRKVSTIGDLDFAAASKKPVEAIEYFLKMPEIERILDKGEAKTNVVLKNGIQVDLLVGLPENYGALLQHFTGSKHHNIRLRTFAEKQGLSLSEYGVKTKDGKVISCKREEDLYKLLKMQTPAPEIREDTGEIEEALYHRLPKLVEIEELKGDLHTHSNFPLEPSHGAGVNDLEEIIKKAKSLGYQYIGISDHPPGFTTHSPEEISNLIAKRAEKIHKLKSKYDIRVLNGLEVDILPDGSLSVPDKALATLDYVIAGVHSSHRMEKDQMTKRLLQALENPYVDIISHPTGRLIEKRDSFDADWEQIFKYCVKHHKLLEINAFPDRLDLRDDLVKWALSFGVKFIIGSDAHEISQMENLKYGVYVARRGWAKAEDIVNTWSSENFLKWFDR